MTHGETEDEIWFGQGLGWEGLCLFLPPPHGPQTVSFAACIVSENGSEFVNFREVDTKKSPAVPCCRGLSLLSRQLEGPVSE